MRDKAPKGANVAELQTGRHTLVDGLVRKGKTMFAAFILLFCVFFGGDLTAAPVEGAAVEIFVGDSYFLNWFLVRMRALCCDR